ncbi:formin-like protein 6 isoform X2 [Aegilops tauschii subsp. strangulata]|uniref:formin-like protein 6 isoform X2 n=1 Tax=Aegilops tauschii subsp. strangulata TaxID=200361 RepID=UPI001ABCED48|nr:formin-like protein 6 isoform X2 [Aegilops tauschii subsp. strangulata]
MSLYFRRLFNRRPPAGLVEISSNILVFDHCFSTDMLEEDELKPYIGGILKQLLARYSIDSLMVFNFEGGKKNNQTARIFSGYNMSAMGYPRNYEGCPLLTLEMIHHFLRSSESWLSLSQDNYLLIHSEYGGWPVLAFALAALLVYLRRCKDERKALEMIHKYAPPGLVELYSPLDPAPSHLRYLKYVSRRHKSPELWPPADRTLNLNCAIIRTVPNFDGEGGCRPIFRIYGPDPLAPHDSSAKVLFSTPKTDDFVQLYTQEDSEIIKINIRCPVRGDVVMECVSVDEDFKHEVMVFRVMFSTAFVEDNLLLLDRDQIDILWDTKHRFPVDFRVEVIFSEIDATTSIYTSEPSGESESNHITDAASEQNGLNNVHDGFDVISMQETEISNGTPEHNIPDSRSVQTSQTEPENINSSAPEAESVGPTTPDRELSVDAPKFEGDNDAIADTSSSQEAESVGPTSQEDELAENASAGEESEGSTTNSTANSDAQLADPPGSEADAATADASAGEESEGSTTNSTANSGAQLADPPGSEADAATAERSDANSESGSPSTKIPRKLVQLGPKHSR